MIKMVSMYSLFYGMLAINLLTKTEYTKLNIVTKVHERFFIHGREQKYMMNKNQTYKI